jgi:hypothetical protein
MNAPQGRKATLGILIFTTLTMGKKNALRDKKGSQK